MKSLRLPLLVLSAATLIAIAPAVRADDTNWQKTYSISAKPSLFFNTGDTSADIHSCGDCREIRVRVEWNDRHASDYTVTESQSGDHVSFELREKHNIGLHITIGNRHEPHVTVETPATLDLEARTSDGSLTVSGLQGDLQLHTSDGSLNVSDVSGGLHIVSSDGSIHVRNASGALESRSSDGSVSISGRFSGIQVHTSDGSLDLTLEEGSHLTAASRVESSDGRVSVRVPATLAADLEIRTGDGHLECKLPLVMQGYDSKSDSGHSISGRLNSGGVPLVIHTHDGNVTIAAL